MSRMALLDVVQKRPLLQQRPRYCRAGGETFPRTSRVNRGSARGVAYRYGSTLVLVSDDLSFCLKSVPITTHPAR